MQLLLRIVYYKVLVQMKISSVCNETFISTIASSFVRIRESPSIIYIVISSSNVVCFVFLFAWGQESCICVKCLQ